MVIDNIEDGYDLYDTDRGTFLRTFPTGTPLQFLPRHVAFAKKSKAIAGGSDHGVVYVFDHKTGTPLDILQCSGNGLVQTVVVSLLPILGVLCC